MDRCCLKNNRSISITDKFAGVKNYDVSLDKQTAHIVTGPSVDYSTVLEKIKKTGKKVNSGSADGVAQAV